MTIRHTNDTNKTGFRYSFRLPLFTLPFLVAAADHGLAAVPSDVSVRNFFGGGMTFDRPVLFAEFPEHDSTYLVVGQFGESSGCSVKTMHG
jgi:hypothetical protein